MSIGVVVLIAVAFLLPFLILAFAAWWQPRMAKKRKEEIHSASPDVVVGTPADLARYPGYLGTVSFGGDDPAGDFQKLLTDRAEYLKRTHGLFNPPNLAITYKCECGAGLRVSLNDFNVFGGEEVTCATCGTVFFLPPEILDHSHPSPSGEAQLRHDWSRLGRFVQHRTR